MQDPTTATCHAVYQVLARRWATPQCAPSPALWVVCMAALACSTPVPVQQLVTRYGRSWRTLPLPAYLLLRDSERVRARFRRAPEGAGATARQDAGRDLTGREREISLLTTISISPLNIRTVGGPYIVLRIQDVSLHS